MLGGGLEHTRKLALTLSGQQRLSSAITRKELEVEALTGLTKKRIVEIVRTFTAIMLLYINCSK
jgi:hypothetical protein